jgi:class I fructose-bisphosphate aldolase
MSLGKQIRLKRLFSHRSGRLCSVAVDHFVGYNEGMPEGLKDLPQTIAQVVAGCPDAITMQVGTALGCWGAHAGKVPLIIQSIAGRPDDCCDEAMAVPEDAVRLGADAFATCAFIRGPSEGQHLRRVADFVRQARTWDMPVILHIYPRRYSSGGKVEIVFEPGEIAWAVRCGIEVGVDVIKTPYCGDPASFRQIVDSCPVPLVAAGGPKASTLKDALAMAQAVVQSGAAGMTIGRNIWGFPHITKALGAFKAVIHEQLTADEAMRQVGIEA